MAQITTPLHISITWDDSVEIVDFEKLERLILDAADKSVRDKTAPKRHISVIVKDVDKL
jgi:hypothetical protein